MVWTYFTPHHFLGIASNCHIFHSFRTLWTRIYTIFTFCTTKSTHGVYCGEFTTKKFIRHRERASISNCEYHQGRVLFFHVPREGSKGNCINSGRQDGKFRAGATATATKPLYSVYSNFCYTFVSLHWRGERENWSYALYENI